MTPTEEFQRFWALGYLSVGEAALLAAGGSQSDAVRYYEEDREEARSGPGTILDLPELDLHRLALERHLVEQGRDPTQAFPVELFAAWLATRPDCPGFATAKAAGVRLTGPRRMSPVEVAEVTPAPDAIPTPSPPGGRVIPLTKWPDYHPWPSVSALRDYVFHAKRNGFDAVVRRVGRRVLIDEDAFHEWAGRRKKPKS